MLDFFTKPPPLSQSQWRLLVLVALAAIFGSYSQALLTLALPQIQASLAVPAAYLGTMGAVIRLGALPAFGFALGADYFGRRRLLLVSMAYLPETSGRTLEEIAPE